MTDRATGRQGGASRARPGGFGLLVRQVRATNRAFWRTPISAFFTFVFPLIFLLLFNLLFSGTVGTPLGPMPYSQVFTPAIAAFAIVTACYTNLAISVSFQRDLGILKRVRGTPLPTWVYLAGRIGSSVWLALLSTVLLFALGALLYDVEVPGRAVGPALANLVIGAASFCALGLAATALAPNADAAPAVANATVLPVTFISGVFFPLDDAPVWIVRLGDFFPVKHLVDAMVGAFSPLPGGGRIEWADLAVVAAWGVAGMLLALRFFRWEPRRTAGRRRGRGRPNVDAAPAAAPDRT